MEENKILIGALIFILLVLGSNLVMYAVVRGAARPGGKGFLETMIKSMNAPQRKKEDPMDELRRTMEELTGGKNNSSEDSE
ncbi:MAG: hypothetical protein DPW18_06010 [Chloroflexi bacterium]|nr:hypothetical protein [Chloroflexota bacterium]MDL1942257.1 hypothetical protein [Chloroflexi bacterium CFX2]